MSAIIEGPWQYSYTVDDETIHYRWRVLRTSVVPPTETHSVVSTPPETGSVLAEGTALTKEAAEHRAEQELTRIVAEARRGA